MDTRIKEQWVKALRSGKYRQTKQKLRDASGYCCLGVLCDLHTKDTGHSWGDHVLNGNYHPYLGHAVLLPSEVCEWAKLPVNEGHGNIVHAGTTSLTLLNDTGRSFEEIADLIEEKL